MTSRKNRDLHGAAPDQATEALLILDMISNFRFPNGARLLRQALPAAERIAKLRDRATAAGVPVIYVNDNAGRWRSEMSAVLQESLSEDSRGASIATLLRPRAIDYAVLKLKHSGFFATPLATLLEHLGVRRLILTGVSTDQCVLFTATDAYVRDFDLVIPRDAVASETVALHCLALQYFARVLGARVPSSNRFRFGAA